MTTDDKLDRAGADAPAFDPGLEVAARRQLTRLAGAIDVAPEPIRLGRRRPRRAGRSVRLIAMSGAVAAAVLAVVAVRSAAPTPDVTVGIASDGERCERRVEPDGVVAAGPLPGGGDWAFRVRQRGDELTGFRYVDGEPRGGWGHNDGSWPSVVNAGRLTGNIAPIATGSIVDLTLPVDTARVDLGLVDGSRARLCPATVPATDVVTFAAVHLPDGADIRSVSVYDAAGRRLAWADDVAAFVASVRESYEETSDDMRVRPDDVDELDVAFDLTLDPALVPLPLGGEAVPRYVDPMASAVEVAGGDLQSGRWSVRVGTNGREIGVGLFAPGRIGHSGSGGTPEQMNDLGHLNWNVDVIDGRYVVWGLAPRDVRTVDVSLQGGTTERIPTVVADVAELEMRVFGSALPAGAVITGMDGRDESGEGIFRAELSGLVDLSGPDAVDGVGLLVEPVE